MKRNFMAVCLAFLISCTSYRGDIRRIKANPDQISQFKSYLEQKYRIDKVDKYETIWGTFRQTDSTIVKFCLKNHFNAIVKQSQDDKSRYYNRYGNIVQLYFNRTPILEGDQTVIFDYTDKGLENYDKEFAKSKIADRIYIFR